MLVGWNGWTDGRTNEYTIVLNTRYTTIRALGRDYVSLMKWRFEKGPGMVTHDTFGGIPGIPFFLWDFGLMTTHDDMRAGQDYVSWLIWPCGLLILQDFTSRYCLTINCISRTSTLNSPPLPVCTVLTPAESSWPVDALEPDECIAATQH